MVYAPAPCVLFQLESGHDGYSFSTVKRRHYNYNHLCNNKYEKTNFSQQTVRVKGVAANASSSAAICVVLQMLRNSLTAEMAIMD